MTQRLERHAVRGFSRLSHHGVASPVYVDVDNDLDVDVGVGVGQ